MKNLSTRERIINEAEKSFISNGIHGTQVKDIAISLGINRRTLYRYFPTKEDLAFSVEMSVMEKFKNSINFRIKESLTGYEKLEVFFNKIDLKKVSPYLRYMAEFDSYFKEDYPSEEIEQDFISLIKPENDSLYRYCKEGIEDGSIRPDFKSNDLYQFISHSFIALFQRIIIREKHIEKEHCSGIDFNALFISIILKGIRN